MAIACSRGRNFEFLELLRILEQATVLCRLRTLEFFDLLDRSQTQNGQNLG